ncbi:hypothetical protein BH09PSE4_BH09PSE4_03440 [soil metagenome]
MSDNNDDKPRKRGIRKDGKPFKEGNTRADGSYGTGKNRPPEEHQFSTGDNRERGKRGKGRKNLLTEWREELDSKMTLTEGGKTKKITKRRALIKTNIERGLKKSDRANETAMRYAELSEKRDPGLQADDLAIIHSWLADMQRTADSDDADQSDEPKPQNPTNKEGTGDGVTGDE